MPTYTTMFADLISRVTPFHSPSLPFYYKAHFLVTFGAWRRFIIPITGLSCRALYEARFHLPYRQKVTVYIVFSQKDLGRDDYLTFFRVWFPYGWYREEGGWMCKFLEGTNLIRFQQVPYIIPPLSKQVRPSGKPAFLGRATDAQILHTVKSVSSTALRSSRLQRNKQYGLFSNSSPRPNPVTLYSKVAVGQEAMLFGNQPIPWNGIDTDTEGYFRSYSGTTTPGFRSMKRSKLPDNSYHLDLRITDDQQAYTLLHQKVSGQYGTYFQFTASKTSALFPFSIPSPAHNAGASDTAIKRAISAAELDLQSNIAQTTAQFGQTTRMIADSATRLRLAIIATKKGRFSEAADALFTSRRTTKTSIPKGQPSKSKSLADNWLAFQYGWKPLLMDIDGSMRALANYMVQTPAVRVVRGSATKKTTSREFINIAQLQTQSKNNLCEICTVTTTKFGVKYAIESPLTVFLSQTGFTNPINLIWEVLPYSFVIDWFLPIGPYLETLSAWHGTVFFGGFKNQFTRQNINASVYYEFQPDLGNPNNFRRSGRGMYNRTWIIHDRGKLNALPTLSFPTLKNPFSVTHAANALALLRGAFRR